MGRHQNLLSILTVMKQYLEKKMVELHIKETITVGITAQTLHGFQVKLTADTKCCMYYELTNTFLLFTSLKQQYNKAQEIIDEFLADLCKIAK